MLSKNLQQCLDETEKTASKYYDKYVNAFDELGCPDDIRNAYCEIAKNNWQLRAVLQHIKEYGAIHNPDTCSACAHNDINHNQVLQKTYKKYKKWIAIIVSNT